MATILRSAIASIAACLAIVSTGGVAAENATETKPPAAEVHELTLDNQVELARSMADHEAVARRFEEEAADFDNKAAEHERLAKSYRSGAGLGHVGGAAVLAAHCENIARNLRQSARDARELARAHRDIAHKVVR